MVINGGFKIMTDKYHQMDKKAFILWMERYHNSYKNGTINRGELWYQRGKFCEYYRNYLRMFGGK